MQGPSRDAAQSFFGVARRFKLHTVVGTTQDFSTTREVKPSGYLHCQPHYEAVVAVLLDQLLRVECSKNSSLRARKAKSQYDCIAIDTRLRHSS